MLSDVQIMVAMLFIGAAIGSLAPASAGSQHTQVYSSVRAPKKWHTAACSCQTLLAVEKVIPSHDLAQSYSLCGNLIANMSAIAVQDVV